MDDLDFLGEETVGIPINNKYRIETLDLLNVVVKERYTPKPKEDEDGKIVEVFEDQWKTISYHANLGQAFRSIVDKEINITVSNGLEAVVEKIEELKSFKRVIAIQD